MKLSYFIPIVFHSKICCNFITVFDTIKTIIVIILLHGDNILFQLVSFYLFVCVLFVYWNSMEINNSHCKMKIMRYAF